MELIANNYSQEVLQPQKGDFLKYKIRHMELWFWLFITYKIIAGTCPFTSKIGSALNFLAMIASYIFVILVFFFAPYWWYGLILIAISLVILFGTPRINTENCNPAMYLYSGLFSHLSPILVILMYLSLFGIL